MPRLRIAAALVAGLIVLVCASPRAELFDFDELEVHRWSIGTFLSTFSGPSHANLLANINGQMLRMQSDPGNTFDDFQVGTPVGIRVHWNISPPISYSATYMYSQYFEKESFNPFEWDSDRSLTTDIHELHVELQHGLSFMRSKRVLPYLGVGLDFAYSSSDLSIDLVNAPGTKPGGEDSPLPPHPDKSFLIQSSGFGFGALAKAGLSYSFTQRIAVTAEIQGVLVQIRQHFDYDGSLQHIAPDLGDDDIYNDPSVNDILDQNYSLDMNGLRLSIGLLVGI